MAKYRNRFFLFLILTGLVLLGQHQVVSAQEEKPNESDLPFIIFNEKMNLEPNSGFYLEGHGFEIGCQYPGQYEWDKETIYAKYRHEIWCGINWRYFETGNTFEKPQGNKRNEEIYSEGSLFVYTTRGPHPGDLQDPQAVTYGKFAEYVRNDHVVPCFLETRGNENIDYSENTSYSNFAEFQFPLNNPASPSLPAIYIDKIISKPSGLNTVRFICVAEERDNNASCSIIRIEACAETNYQGAYLSIHQALLTDLWNFANTFRIGSVGESVSGTGIEDDDTSWVTVVGALGASGGAVGIAAKTLADRARKKSKSGEKKKNEREDEEAIGYILQISQVHLRISQDQPASLEAVVWEVNRQGGYKRATNAALSIEQPANTNFLNITPRQAQGTLNTNLSIVGKVTNPSFQLNVVGRANGTSSSAKVNVEIESEIAIKIETSENRRSLRADGKDGLNVYACLVAEGEIDEKKLEAAQESLEFSISGAGASWLETSEKTKEGEWQTIYIQASKPQGQADSQPPPADVQIIVNGKFENKDLTATITISLVGEATLEYQPDSVNFLLGAGEKSKIKLWINPPGDDAWDFSYVLENESLPVEIDTADEENTSITIIVLERGTR